MAPFSNIIIIGAFPEDTSLIKGGVQASVYGLARSLRLRSDTGTVKVVSLPVTASSASAATFANRGGLEITYLNAYKFLAAGIIHLPLVLRHIRAAGNPVVHIHGTGLIQLALLAILRITRIKCVWTLHGLTGKETLQHYRAHRTAANFARHLFYKIIERVTFKIALHTIVDTPYVLNEMGQRKNIYVIPQGIFTEEFSGLCASGRNNAIVLSVGIITLRKGHHYTLEAFAKVKKKVPQARLVIAGALHDPQYYDQLKTLASELGITGSVEFRLNLPREEIIALLAQAKVFALHSGEESQGVVLCEAFAAGLPVVATRIGGIPYVVTDEKDGFLVDYGDTDTFSSRILSLLADDALYERTALQAKNSSLKYDWKNMTDAVMKVYSTV